MTEMNVCKIYFEMGKTALWQVVHWRTYQPPHSIGKGGNWQCHEFLWFYQSIMSSAMLLWQFSLSWIRRLVILSLLLYMMGRLMIRWKWWENLMILGLSFFLAYSIFVLVFFIKKWIIVVGMSKWEMNFEYLNHLKFFVFSLILGVGFEKFVRADNVVLNLLPLSLTWFVLFIW